MKRFFSIFPWGWLHRRLRRPHMGVQPGAGRPVVLLCFLSPAIAEMLSGSTPPLMFINPVSLFLQVGLYGSGAVLAREVVRRNGLGWANLLLIGAAYGVLEEGLAVMTWFNPYWPDLGLLAHYGRLLDTSWLWALGLTIYHAVISITIPVVLVEALFPRQARLPWLRRHGIRNFSLWLAGTSLFMAIVCGFVAYRDKGFTNPPLMYLGAVLLAYRLLLLGFRVRFSPVVARPGATPPGLWRLRLTGLGLTVAFFFTLWALPALLPIALVTMLLMGALVWWAARLLRRWSAAPGWGVAHRVALVSGMLSFFILLAPLVEFAVRPPGKITLGLSEVAVLWLAGLIWLARRTSRSGAV